MSCGEGPAEERESAIALVEHRAKARSGGVVVHRERAVEIRQLQDWCGGERVLEGVEGRCCLRCPCEALLLEEGGERRDKRAVVLDEPAVITRQS